MGVVYEARDHLNHRLVALKQLGIPQNWLELMSHDNRDSLLASLTKEFEILATFRHPHVVIVYDYGFTNIEPFLVMEMVNESSELLSVAQALARPEQIRLLIQVCQALDYTHRRGVIHRDLKSGNIMVDSQHVVKLLDFGVAMYRERPLEAAGTISHIAPELFMGEPASIASDLYALGVIMYRLWADDYPFKLDLNEDVEAQVANYVVDFAKLEIEPELKSIVGRLLAKDPENRFPTAYALEQALSTAIGVELADDGVLRESYLQAANLVGREPELAWLKNVIETIVPERNYAFLIGGGKRCRQVSPVGRIQYQSIGGGLAISSAPSNH